MPNHLTLNLSNIWLTKASSSATMSEERSNSDYTVIQKDYYWKT